MTPNRPWLLLCCPVPSPEPANSKQRFAQDVCFGIAALADCVTTEGPVLQKVRQKYGGTAKRATAEQLARRHPGWTEPAASGENAWDANKLDKYNPALGLHLKAAAAAAKEDLGAAAASMAVSSLVDAPLQNVSCKKGTAVTSKDAQLEDRFTTLMGYAPGGVSAAAAGGGGAVDLRDSDGGAVSLVMHEDSDDGTTDSGVDNSKGAQGVHEHSATCVEEPIERSKQR
jgi:hypothetical protein